MLTDQQESTLSDKEKIQGRRKQYSENLYGRDKRMTDTFEADSHEEEPVILEREVKATLRVLGRNKLPGVEGIVTIISSHRDGICQNPNKNMLTNMEEEQWCIDRKHSIYIPILKKKKKGDAKKYSNYRTIVLISHTSKVMLRSCNTGFILHGARNAGCSSWIQKSKRHSQSNC